MYVSDAKNPHVVLQASANGWWIKQQLQRGELANGFCVKSNESTQLIKESTFGHDSIADLASGKLRDKDTKEVVTFHAVTLVN